MATINKPIFKIAKRKTAWNVKKISVLVCKPVTSVSDLNSKTVQYTLTNKGHLQLILNRFLYHLNYSYKNSHLRSWRCVDAKVNKCRASVTTKNDIVVRRYVV